MFFRFHMALGLSGSIDVMNDDMIVQLRDKKDGCAGVLF